ncbi:hypothetical protein J7W08_09460 [Methanococcoides orientis]|uniref:hypothetical protein n=1 Tax=Methanococcoides orientis TaxID=2822137 RepID=UPI001E63E5D3|nr:hypothetical protein [Methanococcoides orientis]UGV40300.1 hypothetical protein J7W08_09460 [Methanococcoides orientis]
MSEVAYGKRDLSAIKRKFRTYLLYAGTRIVADQFIDRSVNSILVYPAIGDKNTLADYLNRLAWGFPSKENLSIFVTVSENLKDIDPQLLSATPNQRSYLNSLTNVVLIDENEARKKFDSGLILVTRTEAFHDPAIFLRLHKTMIIDPYYFSFEEANIWKDGYYKTFDKKEIEQFRSISKQNLSSLLKQNKHKDKACCFATGPSFDRYREFDYGNNCFKVICNSTVKNDTFLEYVNGPDILVFADPVFHFSPCEYSSQFRDHVLDVVRKYGCYVMVPDMAMPLLIAHYPELKSKLIGMPSGRSLNIPSIDKFHVKKSSNILTFLMLPIASAVAKKVFIIGADGREPNEKYFWKHSSSVQYDELMKTAFETHPSFFRDRDYKDYYETHCKYLEKLISYGESMGIQYYSLTSSYVPALKKRQIENCEE